MSGFNFKIGFVVTWSKIRKILMGLNIKNKNTKRNRLFFKKKKKLGEVELNCIFN